MIRHNICQDGYSEQADEKDVIDLWNGTGKYMVKNIFSFLRRKKWRKRIKRSCIFGEIVVKYLLFRAEMSEWFKEHDWKSCDGGDSSGGSNPLLCAKR